MRFLVCGLVLSAWVALAEGAANRVAVLVGSNRAAQGRTELRFAHRDAKRMGATLKEVAGFGGEGVLVLEDPLPAEVVAAVKAQAARVRRDDPGAMFVFYFSGHADAESLFTGGEALSLESLRAALEGVAAPLRLGILDACSGGGWTRTKGLVPAAGELVPVVKLLSSEGTALLSSSSGLERAHESDELQGSFFTHHLIVALRGAAAQANGDVTLQGAFRYAEERTVRDSALFAGQVQHPSYALNLHGRHDVLLAQAGPTTGGRMEVAQVEGPMQLISLPSGATVLELPPGQRRVRLTLEPGTYLVRRQLPDGVAAREVSVVSGQSIEVEEDSLTLVGNPILASKVQAQTRPFELSLGGMVLSAAFGSVISGGTGPFPVSETVVSQYGPALSASYRLSRFWGLGVHVAYLNAFRSGPAATRERHFDAFAGVEAQFTPLSLRLGARGRLEGRLALGTTAALVHTVDPAETRAAGTSALSVTWAAVTFSATVRFFFGDRFALFVDARSQLMPFLPEMRLHALPSVGLLAVF